MNVLRSFRLSCVSIGYVITLLKTAKNSCIIDKILVDACRKNFRHEDCELENLYKVTSIHKHFETTGENSETETITTWNI